MTCDRASIFCRALWLGALVLFVFSITPVAPSEGGAPDRMQGSAGCGVALECLPTSLNDNSSPVRQMNLVQAAKCSCCKAGTCMCQDEAACVAQGDTCQGPCKQKTKKK
jgi:hypothetical protein